MNPPSGQPIESTVTLERTEFLSFLENTLAEQDAPQGIRDIASILRDSTSSPELRMICPWYGVPRVEVKMELGVPIEFSERLLRYHAQGLKYQTEGCL